MSEILTHTKRRDWQNCPRYFYHRHEQLLTLRFTKGGRRRGTAFGEAIFDLAQTLADSDEPSSLSLEDVAGAAVARTYEGQWPDNAEQRQEMEIETIKIAAVAAGYARRYGFPHGVPERRELQFDLPLPNPRTGGQSRTFRLGGKIDGMITFSGHHAAVVEDKFVGQIQKAMIERLPLDAQTSEYMDALISRGWSGEVFYRHTLMPGSNPKLLGTKAKGNRRRESLWEYRARLEDDVAARPDHYFDEQRLVFPNDHLLDYRRGRWAITQQILFARGQHRELLRQGATETEARDLAYPMNSSRCWEYGGCEFIPLCTKREDAHVLFAKTDDNPELRKDDDGATSEYPADATSTGE